MDLKNRLQIELFRDCSFFTLKSERYFYFPFTKRNDSRVIQIFFLCLNFRLIDGDFPTFKSMQYQLEFFVL